jgi:hypothetical protein
MPQSASMANKIRTKVTTASPSFVVVVPEPSHSCHRTRARPGCFYLKSVLLLFKILEKFEPSNPDPFGPRLLNLCFDQAATGQIRLPKILPRSLAIAIGLRRPPKAARIAPVFTRITAER